MLTLEPALPRVGGPGLAGPLPGGEDGLSEEQAQAREGGAKGREGKGKARRG